MIVPGAIFSPLFKNDNYILKQKLLPKKIINFSWINFILIIGEFLIDKRRYFTSNGNNLSTL